MGLFRKVFGTKHDRDIKNLLPIIKEINEWGKKLSTLSDDELKAKTPYFRERLKNGETINDFIPEAFAVVREASTRVLKMRHFDVQLIGGMVLFQGKIAEMKTGEGKTLTSTLPLYLYGLQSKGAHLVTPNDYLAKRDSQEMGVLFEWLGLTVGCVVHDLSDQERQVAYSSDITYGTNNEFAFDYLRDNMKFALEDYVQRGHTFCIVDEVDSILIDEARTPLLISGPSEGRSDLYLVANKIIPKLKKNVHFTIDEKSRSAVFTDDGITEVQKLLEVDNLFDMEHSELLHHINQALKAHNLFTKDVDYVVKEGRIIIVDEFTGRLKDGSRWSDGLHQSVEAKEGVEIKSENQTLASITFQNYFKLYERLAGMTGTADTEAEEFQKIYKLDVVVIPTNKPMVRIDDADVIYKNKEGKYRAVVKLIKELHTKGQPVLVGTISIETSELIAKMLRADGVPHEVLNAKQHEKEAIIISEAGRKGAVTIATNMAGRGTDIKLTPETIAVGGLFILGTERHESRRIDNQLRGRSGRQGDPGHSKFFLCLEDDLMRIFGSDRIQKFMHTLGMEDDEPIEHKMISNSIAKAQKKVETHNFEIRKHLLEYDNVMNEQRRVIYRLRKEILGDNDNVEFINEMVEDVCAAVVSEYKPERNAQSAGSWPFDQINHAFKTLFNTDEILTLDECIKEGGDIITYSAKKAKGVLAKKFSQYDDIQVKMAVREILLSIFDHHWKEHLLSMDHLKEGINLRAYAQKDPLNEYKREGFELFEQMRQTVKRAIVETIFTVRLYTPQEIEEMKKKQQEELEERLRAAEKLKEKEEERLYNEARRSQDASEGPKTITRGTTKVGRNDACPCGSGKKYKQCHGAA